MSQSLEPPVFFQVCFCGFLEGVLSRVHIVSGLSEPRGSNYPAYLERLCLLNQDTFSLWENKQIQQTLSPRETCSSIISSG